MQPFFGPVGLFYRSSGMQLPRKGQSMYEYKWNRAVGWLWPEAKLEERFDAGSPRELRGRPLAWWRVVGTETRCPLRWRRDLRLRSVYAASSVTFAACGVAAAAAFGASRFDASLLALVAVSSFQADVTYLGVDHGWRTLDTVLAVVLVGRYAALAARRVFLAGHLLHAVAVPPLALALRCFAASQRSTTFPERSAHHTRWHFLLQLALLLVLWAEDVHLRGAAAAGPAAARS